MPVPEIGVAFQAAGLPVTEEGQWGWGHSPEYIHARGKTSDGSRPTIATLRQCWKIYSERTGAVPPAWAIAALEPRIVLDADAELDSI